MKWIGQGILYFGLYIIFSATFGHPDFRTFGIDWSIALPFILGGLAVVAVGSAISMAAMKADQEGDDTSAKTILRDSPTEADDTFSLFLRPFDVTGKLRIEKPP